MVSSVNNSIWTIDGSLTAATTLGQSGSGINGNESLLCAPQSSSIIKTSISDCLVSYQDPHWEGGSYPSAEMQSVYSAASADWAEHLFDP